MKMKIFFIAKTDLLHKYAHEAELINTTKLINASVCI